MCSARSRYCPDGNDLGMVNVYCWRFVAGQLTVLVENVGGSCATLNHWVDPSAVVPAETFVIYREATPG